MLPKTGKSLHRDEEKPAFAAMMSEALIEDLGQTHRAVKIAMQWTGACERSVKHWIAGTHAPSGSHLLGLMRHSDSVLERLLIASGRHGTVLAVDVTTLRRELINLLALIDGRTSEDPEYRDDG